MDFEWRVNERGHFIAASSLKVGILLPDTENHLMAKRLTGPISQRWRGWRKRPASTRSGSPTI